MNKNISFSELCTGLENGTYNDCNNPVWMGVLLEDTDDNTTDNFIKHQVTDFFRKVELISATDSVVGFKQITGNVLGKNGRTDVMLEISGKGIDNPIARLLVPDLKWASDFVVNHADEYNK